MARSVSCHLFDLYMFWLAKENHYFRKTFYFFLLIPSHGTFWLWIIISRQYFVPIFVSSAIDENRIAFADVLFIGTVQIGFLSYGRLLQKRKRVPSSMLHVSIFVNVCCYPKFLEHTRLKANTINTMGQQLLLLLSWPQYWNSGMCLFVTVGVDANVQKFQDRWDAYFFVSFFSLLAIVVDLYFNFVLSWCIFFPQLCATVANHFERKQHLVNGLCILKCQKKKLESCTLQIPEKMATSL